jgi:hypothetical protein
MILECNKILAMQRLHIYQSHDMLFCWKTKGHKGLHGTYSNGPSNKYSNSATQSRRNLSPTIDQRRKQLQCLSSYF